MVATAGELRRRAEVLHRESLATLDPTLARLLMVRALRTMRAADDLTQQSAPQTFREAA